MRAVRADLRKAEKLDSYHGQMAVKLAQQLAAAGPTGAAGLSRELDRLMSLAIGAQSPGPPPDPDEKPEPEPEDEISAARRRARAKLEQMAARE